MSYFFIPIIKNCFRNKFKNQYPQQLGKLYLIKYKRKRCISIFYKLNEEIGQNSQCGLDIAIKEIFIIKWLVNV